MEKPRIVSLISSLDNGGCEQMLARTLPQLGFIEPVVITLHHPGVLAEKLRSAGVVVECVEWHGFTDIRAYRRLKRRLRELQPVLVITFLFHADAIGRLLVSSWGWKVVPFLRTTYNHRRYATARLFEKLTRPLVKRYFANSQSVKNSYERNIGVKAERITVIENSLTPEWFKTGTSTLLTPLPVSLKGRQVIVCVANLHPNKGHKLLVEAVRQLVPRHPSLLLLLVGEGTERRALEESIKQGQLERHVVLLGQRHDVAAILEQSDIFALATEFEGMSNAVMEAMAKGLPCVVSDIPENQELITNKETGLTFVNRDVESLMQALDELLSSSKLAKELGTKARDKAIERFSPASIIKKWQAAIGEFE